MPSSNVALRIAAFPLIVAAGVMVFAFWPGTASPSADPHVETKFPSISVVRADTGAIASRVRVTGTLVARSLSMVRVELDGARVVELAAEVGDVVAKGDLLARLDGTTIEIERQGNEARLNRANAAIDQAQSAIEDAEAAHERSRSDLERARKLSAKGVVSDATLEEKIYSERSTGSALEAARHGLRLAKADRDILLSERRDIETRLAWTTVSAPVDGLVLQRNINFGSPAARSGDDLFVIADHGTVEMEGRIPQMDLARIGQGAAAEIHVPGYRQAFAGTVRLIKPELTSAGRMGIVRIALEADVPLPIGAFARGEVVVGHHAAVLVPSSAVISKDGRAEVYVVEGDVVHPRAVATGLRSGEMVEIVSGLDAGETVVLKSARFLDDGDRIEPVDSLAGIASAGAVSMAAGE
ncbi:efflux RND transporter periplasmic adaptor subunit [Acuticoccus mangrovi]|uniref:Efflux RND transporter periplasmic adaptor subunit n=1 Tax=Acuticoccus mangrovi TaxID=2796142 RepID=A0A934IN43_9HYPH|nr:efflux RND transporter periplasmic adaptor subunit [Acuticoccus mangrovi]MBJ3775655.1 efflux RND transporter periplasmic adaptor subunit [Acuticoccus mangrovi]